jgi:hypothetical protein
MIGARQRPVITSDFFLQAKSLAQNPEKWINRNQRNAKLLRQVQPVIEPLEMRDLVTQNVFPIFRGKIRFETRR